MFPRLPPVTKALLIANIVVFAVQKLLGDFPLDPLRLWAFGPGEEAFSGPQSFMPWQLLTYGFLHGDLAHLAFNMLTLAMFGAPLEYTWGKQRYLSYYLICIVGAGLCQLAVGAWTLAGGGPHYATVGASGGIFGLLLAYGLLFPHHRVMLLIPPIPMKARTLVVVCGVLELLLGFTGLQPGVAHFAHLGGMLFGWLVIRYWRGLPPFGRRGPPKLRVIR